LIASAILSCLFGSDEPVSFQTSAFRPRSRVGTRFERPSSWPAEDEVHIAEEFIESYVISPPICKLTTASCPELEGRKTFVRNCRIEM